MTEAIVIHPIARALLAGPDLPDRDVPCAVCRKPAACPGYVWESVKLWNRREAEAADKEQRRAVLIGGGELGITCAGECTRTEYIRRHGEAQRENETTMAYLKMLRAGTYNPESLAWLRGHGHGKTVARLLASAGTEKTNA